MSSNTRSTTKSISKTGNSGNIYLYDKNDTSQFHLLAMPSDFGKPQGAASPLVGWAAGAFCVAASGILI